ncbi:MAG TPA: SCO family protein [Pyrinomonadaceae bacterium]
MKKPFGFLLFVTLILATAGISVGQNNPKPAEGPASYFPNSLLITQDNQKVKFYDDLLKNKIVVINFMFTTCTTICPPMTATLSRVQRLLGDRSKDVNFISISVDPTTDTPERLKAYADRFKAQPGWYFLGGDQANVDVVLHKLGGHVANKNEHTVMLMIGDAANAEWKRMYALSKPSDIAAHITEMLDARVTK